MQEELEKKASRVRGMLNKLLRIDDQNIRTCFPSGRGEIGDLDHDGPFINIWLNQPDDAIGRCEPTIQYIGRSTFVVWSTCHFSNLVSRHWLAKSAGALIFEFSTFDRVQSKLIWDSMFHSNSLPATPFFFAYVTSIWMFPKIVVPPNHQF